jgi:hypothetical protein
MATQKYRKVCNEQAELANQAAARSVIPVEESKFEADRAHSHVIELNSSHAIPITFPDVVVDVIEQAARAVVK